MKSGIYFIKRIGNDKIYIGKSSDINSRIQSHFRLLKKGKHHCKDLQKEFNIFKRNLFEFGIIEKCSLDFLDKKERFYINSYKKEELYNTAYLPKETRASKFRNKNNSCNINIHIELNSNVDNITININKSPDTDFIFETEAEAKKIRTQKFLNNLKIKVNQ